MLIIISRVIDLSNISFLAVLLCYMIFICDDLPFIYPRDRKVSDSVRPVSGDDVGIRSSDRVLRLGNDLAIAAYSLLIQCDSDRVIAVIHNIAVTPSLDDSDISRLILVFKIIIGRF